MKDLSFFLLKNSLASKMKKGLRSFCNGVVSTSTLNQRKTDLNTSFAVTPSLISSYFEDPNLAGSTPTLEEMLLQLDLEEEAARKAKLEDYGELRRRMSCVNNSDILRSAKNALDQYPRFSLDGRDAMNRSTFRNFGPQTGAGGYEMGRKSVCCSGGLRGRLCKDGYDLDLERSLGLPPNLAGESVVWCKPGVVAKLMGLEAMPVPISRGYNKRGLISKIRRESLWRAERFELEKRRLRMGENACRENARESTGSSCSTATYYAAKLISAEPAKGRAGWPIGRVR
eukprot:TRINITY_DN22060_c0_g1_i1.p1 TRINITY_DN22060_c0_g1~~TRINITY_DN22060_c0_g1_i1.p1  ORF type:complete len:285 (+),score=33.14 TRINITY_DN22060_c0_g1_i1:12-866(+)